MVKKGQRWRAAVAKVLPAAGIDQKTVAGELGWGTASLNHYFTGRRTPAPDMVKSIDDTIAKLAGRDRVADFLDFEAVASELIPDERGEALAKGVFRMLRWYASYFKQGGVDRIVATATAFDEPPRHKLFVRLGAVLRRIVIEELLPPKHPVGFSAICHVLRKSGIVLDGILSERSAALIAWEKYEQAVRHELFEANPQSSALERAAAAERIRAALSEAAFAALTVQPDAASGGHLIELRTPWSGKVVSQFSVPPGGDQCAAVRAVWAPFTSPPIAFKAPGRGPVDATERGKASMPSP